MVLSITYSNENSENCIHIEKYSQKTTKIMMLDNYLSYLFIFRILICITRLFVMNYDIEL